MHQICDFKGENWRAGLRRLKFLSLIDQIICKNNYQNTVFLSEALHGEIIIWNNQIFEEGYLSNPKYLGPTFLFNIQLVPKSFSKYYWILLWLWLFMTQVVKYTMKVKVIKYFLQIFVIWNNGARKKWEARYIFWYIVLLTLCNGDRRIVQCHDESDSEEDDDEEIHSCDQCGKTFANWFLMCSKWLICLLGRGCLHSKPCKMSVIL